MQLMHCRRPHAGYNGSNKKGDKRRNKEIKLCIDSMYKVRVLPSLLSVAAAAAMVALTRKGQSMGPTY